METIIIAIMTFLMLFLYRVNQVYKFRFNIIRLDNVITNKSLCKGVVVKYFKMLPDSIIMLVTLWKPLKLEYYFSGVDLCDLKDRMALLPKDLKPDHTTRNQIIVLLILILGLIFMCIYPIL